MEEATQKVSGWKSVASNLPALEGSEKQISWAEDIRKQKIESFNKEIEQETKFEEDYWVSRVLRKLAEWEYIRMETSVQNELKAKGTPTAIYEPDPTAWGGYRLVKEDYTRFNVEMKKQSEKIFEEILKTRTSASYWIDRR